MGNAQSTESIDPATKGYHVLKPNSPASNAGLVGYFDFLVAINGQSLHEDTTILPQTIKANVDKPVIFNVFSSKWSSYREVTLVPSQWGEPKDGLIGCSIRYCEHSAAADQVWHVVQVQPNSPASAAGLQVDDDYIVGCPDVVLHSQQELYALIADRAEKQAALKFFVYNVKSDELREVALSPSSTWGGNGLIGAELGYGVLHKIPTQQPPQTGDAAAEQQQPEQQPASSSQPPIDPASLTPMADVPVFAPSKSRYAQTLIPVALAVDSTGSGEAHSPVITPATEFSGLPAPPTDAVLHERRQSAAALVGLPPSPPLPPATSELTTVPETTLPAPSATVPVQQTEEEALPIETGAQVAGTSKDEHAEGHRAKTLDEETAATLAQLDAALGKNADDE
ncbi:hypothetical protein RI367_007420 [Sorochytrium milnesiophthora]